MEAFSRSITKKGEWVVFLCRVMCCLYFFYFVLFDRVSRSFPLTLFTQKVFQTSTKTSQLCILAYSLVDVLKKMLSEEIISLHTFSERLGELFHLYFEDCQEWLQNVWKDSIIYIVNIQKILKCRTRIELIPEVTAREEN